MPSPVEQFWGQYKDSVHASRRRLKYRIGRLVWAFVMTMMIAPFCYAIDRWAGMPTLAIAFGIVAQLLAVGLWWIIESFWRAQSGSQPALTAEIVPAQFAGPAKPFVEVPSKRSGNGLLIALCGTFAVLALSCCGGGIVLATLVTHWAATQPATPESADHFGFSSPPMSGPFGDLHRQHQDQLDEMRRQQERAMRDLRHSSGFGP